MTQPSTTTTGQALTPAQMAALLALVQAQARVRQQLTATAVAAVLMPFRALSGADWWNSGKVSAAIRQALMIIQPAQRNAVALTDAYLARTATIMTGRTVRPAGPIEVTRIRRRIPADIVEQLVAEQRRPAWIELGDTWDGPADTIDDDPVWAVAEQEMEFLPPSHAYGRVADAYRWQVTARGDPPETAQGKAIARLTVVAQTDVTLAVREQYRRSLGQIRADGYRRILHPELSETGPCGLCAVAADRTYRTGDLLPLHAKCVCEVLPIYGDLDPGLTLNADDLGALYATAGGTRRELLRKVRVVLAEHGELGPTLINGDQHYRDPIEVARTRSADKRVRDQAQLDALLEIHDISRHRADHGENLTRSLRWQRERIAELQVALRKG
ncbi:hypothetical protein [Actinoplanes derwentensis]|uniref:Phage Mu protein F like protein n=1 Tax=Actinoplanes derwentensis TaxID=113562 RepID=A0A1H2CVD3_9ACTN|nr:hypothetical protein [Actinoplanes derwentensis]GID82004.1 hypothetical protein Ade03nite_09280 [Actinoplanes derwentensis]SDT74334.1 hypothetical protein SAMN04489716_6950 [Actinoplanes derwentensis]